MKDPAATTYIVVAIISLVGALISALVAGLVAWVSSRQSNEGEDQRAFVEQLRQDRNDMRTQLTQALDRIHDLEVVVRQLGGTP